MSSGYTWDGLDFKTEWNVQVLDVKGHLDMPNRKGPTEYDFGYNDMGVVAFTTATDIVVQPRDIRLKCKLEADTNANFVTRLTALRSKLCETGLHELVCKKAYNTYVVYHRDKSDVNVGRWNTSKNIGTFDIVLREPMPVYPLLWKGLGGHWSFESADEVYGTTRTAGTSTSGLLYEITAVVGTTFGAGVTTGCKWEGDGVIGFGASDQAKPVRINDLTDFANDGMMYSLVSGVTATYVVDRESEANSALDFDGTDDYIDTGDAFQSTFRDSFSISMWVKPDDGQPAAIEIPLGAANSPVQDAVFCRIQTTGKIIFYYESDNDSASAQTSSAVFSDSAESWHHIACVANNDISQMDIYFDGAKQTVDSSVNGDMSGVIMTDFATSDNIYIGAYNSNGTATNFFDGDIHDVRLYGRALSAHDVKLLYKLHNNAIDY